LDSEKRIIQIVNNYEKISFNFGPTLLSWMQSHAKDAYHSILEADQESQKRFSGHGAALAQCYNHMIMPLANAKDRRTQVVWGIKDFESRFKRKPEGMWLPETAVDIETLEIMALEGIKFTVLAPHQGKPVKKVDKKTEEKSIDEKRSDVKEIPKKVEPIDPAKPYLCRLPSGRSISVFFYDGVVSHEVAFGDLLKNGENLAQRLAHVPSGQKEGLSHIATDGETYGHHHRYGEMALSYCLYFLEEKNLARLTIYAEYLEKFPPTEEVEIIENTSWSCFHGVQRWQDNCGCAIHSSPGWKQDWRKPLRESLDWLRDQLAIIYEHQMNEFSDDPWGLRDKYIDVVLDRSRDNVEGFLRSNAKKELSFEEKSKVIKLLELQRNCMLMYTSCGWFFDEISGIESTQILHYASRVIQLAQQLTGTDLEPEFLKLLEKAPSNVPALQNGAVIYERYVKPNIVDLLRVGAHHAVSSLFERISKTAQIYSYTANNQTYDLVEVGKQRLAVGKALIRSNITWEENIISFAVLHLGDHNLTGGVQEFKDEKLFNKIHKEIKDVFRRNDIPATIRAIEKYFNSGQYSLWHLFKDEQIKILYQILDSTLEEIESSLRQINEYHYPIIQVMKQLHIPLPKVLANTVLVMLNKDLLEALGNGPDFERLEKLVQEVREWSLEIDKVTLEFVVKQKVNGLMADFLKEPEGAGALKTLETLLRTLSPLHLNLDLWRTQNIYFFIGKKFHSKMRDRAGQADEKAKEWLEYFNRLGDYLRVKVG
ncbi:MAG: hypothetical protein A2Z88_07150, partial [Omnitrophica WOR_2 bacterium GWA2_47_8]